MNKYKTLVYSIIFDAIGLISFVIPGIGEFSDVVWAPVSAFLIYTLYGGMDGKVAAGITFLEEILPGTDFIPTFTAMWLYRHVLTRKSAPR